MSWPTARQRGCESAGTSADNRPLPAGASSSMNSGMKMIVMTPPGPVATAPPPPTTVPAPRAAPPPPAPCPPRAPPRPPGAGAGRDPAPAGALSAESAPHALGEVVLGLEEPERPAPVREVVDVTGCRVGQLADLADQRRDQQRRDGDEHEQRRDID